MPKIIKGNHPNKSQAPPDRHLLRTEWMQKCASSAHLLSFTMQFRLATTGHVIFVL